ncbi:MAG: hydantoinase/oxoprolinase family protein [Lachnospiraceae bacterium]|nr:hydantoinase/oxoprolinase family protein [Lachnospiraceae bacterium]
MYKLGIDVGGTNTDAVLIDEELNVAAEVKFPTSEDIYGGILGAVRAVLGESGVDRSQIRQAMLGTTQCTNAIVERKNLAPVGILRIGAPATLGIRPMADWAEDIRRIAVGTAVVGGGFEYDGRELAPFDREAAAAFFLEMKEAGVRSIAISCVFSTVRNDHELEAAKLCQEIMGEDVHVSISSEIGSMGLIERENAAILNAALWQVAGRFTDGFAESLEEEGIAGADVYLSQNDGTLMTMEHARRYPILTVACGPTNSIRGASYLSRLRDAIVIDVGGTTTDLGVIHKGFPRESGVAVTIGGVRTNFRMPDVISIGLGGGSIVRGHGDGSVTVGPDSVGYEITKKALVFGGDVMTATDIAVRLGMADLGDPALVADIPLELAEKALAAVCVLLEDSIDAMKVSNGDIDVILVGGGSIIVPEQLAGAARVVKPEHFGCANAIGSAISKVSGTYEKLMDYDEIPRERALEQARAEAVEAAVKAGAVRETVEIIEVEDVPLAYYPGNTNRVKVKAAGDLRMERRMTKSGNCETDK